MKDGTRAQGIADPAGKTGHEFAPEIEDAAVAPTPKAGLIRLDIACGKRKQAGFVGIDVAPCEGVDVVADLFRFPWPVESDSVQEAYCSHFVEHIPHAPPISRSPDGGFGFTHVARSVDRWGFVRDVWFDFFEEVHRVLVPGGLVKIVCPYATSLRADQDPTHTRRICEASFLYLTQEWLKGNELAYPFEADFEIVDTRHILNAELEGRSDAARADMLRREWNAVDDIHVVLRAKKPAKAWWRP